MPLPVLGAAEARRVALAAQGFGRRRPAAPQAQHLHAAMDRLGVLQIDSVNVFARSHYMPMFSRLGAYDPALLDSVFLSPSGRYVEYLAHEAAFMPVEDWPLWAFRREEFARRYADGGRGVTPATLEWIRAELRGRGPSRPAEMRGDAPSARSGWWNWDETKQGLEILWRTGEVAVSGRRGFERVYALADDVVPRDILSREVSRDDAIRELVRRAVRSHGVATESDIADYPRLRDRARVRSSIRELVDAGEILPVEVRGWERGGRPLPAWMHADAAVPSRVSGSALLTPFDPVVWFRERALRAFGLDYRIEIYTPAARRCYGYYCLPVLVGDRIVARVDLKADRAASVLRVQAAWWEPAAHAVPAHRNRRGTDAEAIAGELRRAAAWQGLEGIHIAGRGDAADELNRLLPG